MANHGYEEARFVSIPSDNFQCIVCNLIVRDPWECHSCGKMFCKLCISDWMTKNLSSKCPFKCADPKISAVTSRALLRLYYDLDIRCSNIKCNKVVKLFDLEKHESYCTKVKCWNFDNCEKTQDQKINCTKPCCSFICQLLYQLNQNFGNLRKMYQILERLMKSYNSNPNLIPIPKKMAPICWDTAKMGTGIQTEQNATKIFLKEQSYVFRSVLASFGFTGGINYWEIIADSKTQNQLKIGVSTSRDFDIDSAFCDHPFGFAYYGIFFTISGLGQLRHNSNASGPAYGKRFKKEGTLGCCLNMEKGTLSFALNGDYWGVAFTDPKLREGTIYPAVSLLHCAGCKIRGNLPLPAYFKD